MAPVDLAATRPRRDQCRFDHEEARNLRRNGMTFAAIAAKFGVSATAVSKACEGIPAPVKLKPKKRPDGRRGPKPERRGIHANLQRHDWPTILRLDAEGLSQVSIARQLGMSQSQVSVALKKMRSDRPVPSGFVLIPSCSMTAPPGPKDTLGSGGTTGPELGT